MELPTTLGQILGDESIVQDDAKQREDDEVGKKPVPQTFAEAVEALHLPRAADIAGKKGAAGPANKKKDNMKFSAEHLALEKIDLSGYKTKRFTRAGLKELVEGISLLPCIRTVILRDNGIGDECEAELLELIANTSIKCLDLSKNNIGPKLASQIGKRLKDEVTHIQWLDLTQNEFYNDNPSNSLIVQGLKKQLKLMHVGLCISTALHPTVQDQFIKLLAPKRPPLSLNMRNSPLVNKHSQDYLFKSLTSADFYLTSLSLKFCYLTFEQMLALGNALRFNKTLVKLDLGSNGLKACTVRGIMDALMDNCCLNELSVSSNFLDDEFAKELAQVL